MCVLCLPNDVVSRRRLDWGKIPNVFTFYRYNDFNICSKWTPCMFRLAKLTETYLLAGIQFTDHLVSDHVSKNIYRFLSSFDPKNH